MPFRLGSLEWFSPFIRRETGSWGLEEYAGYYLGTIVVISLMLGTFNLIPIAPLDGFKVAVGVLPRDLSRSFAQLERIGPVILMSLIALQFFPVFGFRPLTEAMLPLIGTLAELFTGVDGRIR